MRKNLLTKTFGIITSLVLAVSSAVYPVTAYADNPAPATPSSNVWCDKNNLAERMPGGDLTDAVFASAVKTDDSSIGTLSPTDLFIRYDGSNKINSSLTFDGSSLSLNTKPEHGCTLHLVIQGNNNGSDWFYRKQISLDASFNPADELSELRVRYPDLELSKCKIWLEAVTTEKTYAVFAKTVNKPSSGASSGNNTACYQELENKIYEAINSGNKVIYYESDELDSLPNYIMQLLAQNPDLALDFTFKYQGENENSPITYNIYIAPGAALNDDTPVYGAECLIGNYKATINPNKVLLTVSANTQQSAEPVYANGDTFKSESSSQPPIINTASGENASFDLKVHAPDARSTANQNFLARNLIKPDVNILITENITSRKDFYLTEKGCVELSWSNLPKNAAGPVYAVVYNQEDGAYVLNGNIDKNGVATFSGFKLRPASTITICK